MTHFVPYMPVCFFQMPLLSSPSNSPSVGQARASSSSSSSTNNHDLLSTPSSGGNSRSNHTLAQTQSSSGLDSDDDFEDASDHMVVEDDDWPTGRASTSRRMQPLIPDDYGDEAMAGIKFGEEFGNRYGHPHPAFFPGSLDDAIKESCLQPPKEVR